MKSYQHEVGKRSALEAIPGAMAGYIVGFGAAYVAKKTGIPLPDDLVQVVTDNLATARGGLGAVISSYILGRRR